MNKRKNKRGNNKPLTINSNINNNNNISPLQLNNNQILNRNIIANNFGQGNLNPSQFMQNLPINNFRFNQNKNINTFPPQQNGFNNINNKYNNMNMNMNMIGRNNNNMNMNNMNLMNNFRFNSLSSKQDEPTHLNPAQQKSLELNSANSPSQDLTNNFSSFNPSATGGANPNEANVK
jgi:hypothetical protein